jgi:drug/metabolite transporter (DMT)-like permease
MSADLLGKILSLSCAVLWATAVLFFRKAGERVSPITLNLIKNAVAVVLFSLTLPLLGVALFAELATWKWIVVGASGVLGIALGDALFFAALNRLGAGLTAIVDCSYSPTLILLSALFLGEPLTLELALGAVLVVGGLLLVFSPKQTTTIDRKQLISGFLCGFFGIVAMAASLVMVKPILTEVSVMWVIWWRMMWGFLGLVIWIALHPARKKIWCGLKKELPWKVVLIGSVMGGYLATIVWLFGMRYTEVSVASVLNQLSTLFIILFAALFLAEPLNRRKISAALLGFSGAVAIFLPAGFLWRVLLGIWAIISFD